MSAGRDALNVLVVEDSPDDAELLLRELGRAGLAVSARRVDSAAGLTEALRSQRWDVILCDHAMPGFSSQGALQIIRELGVDAPFIIVSGTIGEEHAVAAMRAGCHDYIMKGSLKRLAPAVERELREAGVRQARRQAEQELRRTTSFLNCILASATEFAIVAIDLEGRVIHCNPAAERLLEVRAADAVGRSLEDTGIHRRVTSESLAETLELIDQQGQWVCEHEVPGRGGTRTLRSVMMRMQDETGARSGYLLFAHDITAQKAAERQQRQLEAELQQAQKLESLGVMAGGIAHDFNNLLMVIRGNVELLPEAIAQDPAARPALDNIETAIRHAGALTQGLQTFSRPARTDIRTIDVNAIVREAYNLMRRVLPRSIEFEIDLDPAPCLTAGDAVQIQQVLINLCLNARDAMPGGGRLTIQTRPARVDELSPPSRERLAGQCFVRLRVTDTGCGLDPRTLARVFDPFFTTKPKGMGTGLGLAVAYRIVQAHHGAIEVSSTPGRGTRFDVLLPFQESAEAEPGAPARAAEDRRLRILVVHGEEVIAGLLKTLLEKAGHDVRVCHSAGEAMRHDDAPPADLAIVASELPDMPGARCIEALRGSRPDLNGILIVRDTSAETASAGPRTRVLCQPFSAAALLAAVRRATCGGAGENHPS